MMDLGTATTAFLFSLSFGFSTCFENMICVLPICIIISAKYTLLAKRLIKRRLTCNSQETQVLRDFLNGINLRKTETSGVNEKTA